MMHGFASIERFLCKYYSKSTPILLSFILGLCIINVNHHYSLLLQEDARKKEIIALIKYEIVALRTFVNKILISAEFMGKENPYLNIINTHSDKSLLAIKRNNIDTAAHNLAKAISLLESSGIRATDIRIINALIINNTSADENELNPLLLNHPILMAIEKSQVFACFAFDGTESSDVLKLITEYLKRWINNRG